ncbi:hypothetical protein RMCBS344292_08900 [Rhizopus microsporus]|nr:hypothetical protein RMCBS344292_08900 [Rhizopus microsporus]
MTFKNPATLTQKGHAEVGQSRESKPVKIYYEIHGNGPQLVMLVMGLALACGAWDYQTKYLAETGQYSVLVFDNRGVGHSDAPIGLYSTSQMAQDALELLDHVGWHDRVHLVGISMGAQQQEEIYPHGLPSLPYQESHLFIVIQRTS